MPRKELGVNYSVTKQMEVLVQQEKVKKRAWSEIKSAFEDQFPSGRPAWESVLGDACVFVEDAQPFSDLHLKVFEGIGDSSPSGHQE